MALEENCRICCSSNSKEIQTKMKWRDCLSSAWNVDEALASPSSACATRAKIAGFGFRNLPLFLLPSLNQMVPSDRTAESWTSSILSEAQQDKGTTAAFFFFFRVEVVDTLPFWTGRVNSTLKCLRTKQQQLKFPHRRELAKGRWHWRCLSARRLSPPQAQNGCCGAAQGLWDFPQAHSIVP